MRRTSLMVLSLMLTLLPGCDGLTGGPTSVCTSSYCGDVLMNISMSASCQGFGYQSQGTVTLTFTERPPDYTVSVRLNAQSISGRARTYSRTTVEVPISGSSVACPFKQPSDLVVTDPADVVLKTIRFNWNGGGCSSCF